jgi:hypothetical protein
MSARSRLMRSWLGFWFIPAGPGTLGFLRLSFCLVTFAIYAFIWESPKPWTEVSDVFWIPTGIFRVLHLPCPKPEAVEILWRAWLVLLGAGVAGLITRVSLTGAFAIGTYLIGLPYNFGIVGHVDTVVVFTLAILAFARSGDAWSFDAWLRRCRHPDAKRAESGEYTWPVRAVWVVIAFIYFSSGLTKLITSGPAWATSDTLAIHITQLNSYYYYLFYPAKGAWGMELVRQGWPLHLLAAATMIFELAFPLALFDARARLMLVPAAVMFNTAAFLTMGPYFVQLVACNLLFWIPWDRIGRTALAILQGETVTRRTLSRPSIVAQVLHLHSDVRGQHEEARPHD